MGILLYFKELKLENIDSNEFEKMKKMFTEDVVNSFFEDVLQENNKEAIDKVNKIMETYLLDFENQMSNTVIDCGDRYVTDAFSGYMSSISNLKVLSSEEEMKYGKLLLENRDVFSIPMDDVKSIITKKNINKSDKKILDLEKIFVSIKDKSDMKDIIRMLENYYNNEIWNETNVDKILRYYIREYKILGESINGVPDSLQLNNYFENNYYNTFTNFDKNKEVKDIKELKKNLKKYLTYMYARNVMVMHNLRLVCAVAYKYGRLSANIMDVVSDGNIGLLRAVDKYDYTKGKFSSYAYWGIKQSIIRERDNNDKLVRVPIYLHDVWRSISKFRRTYDKENGKEASSELIALNTGFPLDVIERLIMCEDNYFVHASLNTKSGKEDDIELIDSLNSRDLPVEEQAMRNVVNSIIIKVLDELNERDREIIFKRFGIDGNGGRSLEEVGKEYNISRQRINQIESRIFRKMIKKKEIRNLKGFYK